MAETNLSSALEKQVWSKEYLAEYVRESGFLNYMGRKKTSVICTMYELASEAGKTINIPLITKLNAAGVRGSGVLDGKEEQLGNYNCAISVDWLRNAVKVPKSTSYKTEIDLLNAGRDMLKLWSADTLRADLIKYMAGPTVTTSSLPAVDIVDSDGNTVVTAATEGNYDTWATANSDRILYGAAISNYSAGDHSASLANIDNSADKLTVAMISLAKRIAKSASPAIRPFRLEDGREYFVMFVGARAFRDLKLDTAMINANRDARAREGNGMDNNPLFQDGDLLIEGVIVRQIEEITSLITTASTRFSLGGAGNITVEPNFLCGQQAMGVVWGQEPMPITDMTADYKFRPGVAIEELRGIAKLHFGTGSASASKQQGMVTVYSAGVGD
jgi:N4-gp56 family major capsid protein